MSLIRLYRVNIVFLFFPLVLFKLEGYGAFFYNLCQLLFILKQIASMALFKIIQLIRKPQIIRNFCCKDGVRTKTAGVIVIGDEILKGDVLDTNSPFLIRELHKLGVRLKKVSLIGDNVEEICNEVRVFSRTYDYVITSGGIGPTHDDVTFEAVARAFDDPLVLNTTLRKLCEMFYETTNSNHPGMKLAKIPQSAQLLFFDSSKYPNVSVKNVYMFPGIPEFFEKAITHLSPKLFKTNTIFYRKSIYLNITEDKICDELTELIREFPDVEIGSYPKLFDKSYKVKIVIESINEETVRDVCNKFVNNIPKSSVVSISDK